MAKLAMHMRGVT